MYKSRRRPWVKLYCREWLTSTVRFDLTESDRSRFIDLLALAGDSKVPGVVCAGYDGGKLSGYPIDWLAATMRCSVQELQKSLEKFTKSDRVSITSQDQQPVIRITGWKKYQSEYLRQIEAVKERKSQQKSPQLDEQSSETSTQLPNTEVEVEGEVEVEVEKPRRSAPLVLPEWVPVDTWSEFMKSRRALRKAPTPFAQKCLLKDLERLKEKGYDPREILEQSIKHGWSGLFEPKQNGSLYQSERDAKAQAEARVGIGPAAPPVAMKPETVKRWLERSRPKGAK